MKIKILIIFLLSINFLEAQSKSDWNIKYEDYLYIAASNRGLNKFISDCQSSGGQQEHYYAAWTLEGLIAAWRATGDLTYLDLALDGIKDVIDNAVIVTASDGTYLGWPGNRTDLNPPELSPKGYPLWESYFWRHVATMLRIMYQSPNLRATEDYQDEYDTILAFIERNIWEKWSTDSLNNLYRSRTHMASHWARIGMELHIITGKQKYLDVFENISWKGFPAGVNFPGSNLRSRIYDFENGYSWYQQWNSDVVQDTGHGGDIMSFIAEAVDNGYYWTLSDVEKFKNVFNDRIWYSNVPVRRSYNVDGTGTGGPLIHHSWLNLARFDQPLQDRINTYYYPIPAGSNTGDFACGVALLNTAQLEDTVVYPEEAMPVITLNGSNPIFLQVGQSYNEPGATATNTSNPVVITGTVNTSVAGTYYRYYNVSNEVGPADEVIRTVIVQDTPTPPTPPTSSGNGINYNLWLSIIN